MDFLIELNYGAAISGESYQVLVIRKMYGQHYSRAELLLEVNSCNESVQFVSNYTAQRGISWVDVVVHFRVLGSVVHTHKSERTVNE